MSMVEVPGGDTTAGHDCFDYGKPGPARRWTVRSSSMGRLCERPGCSDPASVAYGMVPEDLVFWIDVTHDNDDIGVLCRRHADAMVLPRGWTLDDRRDPDLHLFRPPEELAVARTPRARRSPSPDDTQQLQFGAESDSWAPSFDSDDDLGGLLSATSPLLARAFRGDGRPRSA